MDSQDMANIPGTGQSHGYATSVHKPQHPLEETKTTALPSDKGISPQGRNITRHSSDIRSVQQGVRLTTPLFDRKITHQTNIKTKLTKIYQWLKDHLLPGKKTRTGPLKTLPEAFYSKGTGTKQAQRAPSIRDYLIWNDYPKKLQGFMEKVDTLHMKFGTLNKDAKVTIKKLLTPERTSDITNQETLQTALSSHNITLAIPEPADTSGDSAEQVLTLTNEQLKGLRNTLFFQAYQLYLLLQGIQQAVSVQNANMELADNDSTIPARAALEEFRNDELPDFIHMTIGLCHAAIKAEMPELYDDFFYTALSLQDKKGRSHFRSDTIQPRNGWMDGRTITSK